MFKWPHANRLGLEKGDFGVMIPQDLYAHGKVYLDAPASFRLTYLEHLPSKLVKCVLGGAYSEAAIGQFIADDWKLFSAYGHHDEALVAFISSVAETELGNLVFWVLKPNINLPLKEVGKLLGFKSIQVCYEVDGKTLSETTTFTNGSGEK